MFGIGRYWKVLEGFTVITKLITACITVAFINLSSQKEFMMFINFNFLKKLRYSIILKHQTLVFRLHPPFSTRDLTRLYYFIGH